MARLITLGGLGVGLLALLIGLTPWDAVPAEPAAPELDFTAGQLARSEAYQNATRLASYGSWAVGIVAAVLLGFTRWGSRLSPPVRRWWLRVPLTVLVVTGVVRLLALPFDIWLERERRAHGLSTQGWAAWTLDLLLGFGVGFVAVTIGLLGLCGLARRWPRRWWAPAAVGAAGLVMLGSFVYPVLVEPLFNRFTPMATGPLRTSLLQLAEGDGVPVRDVLVADASRRTTALNAYVSGFGATRRLVVYDTLLRAGTPDEVRVVVAHELGHAKRQDVLTGSVTGAVGIAFGTVLLAVVLDRRWPRVRSGAHGPGDPRMVALVLALTTAGALFAGPVENLVSRRVETQADLHALRLTGDTAAFVRVQRRLAKANRSDLSPSAFRYVMFASHPTAPQRIALARAHS